MTPVIEVSDQGRQGEVQRWNESDANFGSRVTFLQASIEVVVSVPPALVDRHKRNATFDQSSRQQAALTNRLAAVALAKVASFFGQIESVLCLAGRDQTVRSFQVGVGDCGGRLLDDMAELVERVDELTTTVKTS